MINMQFMPGYTLDLFIMNLKIMMLLSAMLVVMKRLFKSTASLRHFVWFMLFLIVLLMPLLSILTPQWHLPLLKIATLHAEYDPIAVTVEAVHTVAEPGIEPALKTGNIAPIQPARHSVNLEWRSLFRTPFVWIVLWTIGFFLFNLRYIFGQFRMQKLMRKAKLATDERTSLYRSEIKRRYKISSPVRILTCQSVATPLATGFFRHTIILPDNYVQWSGEHLKFVLLHEAAHIKRRDVITHFIVQFVTTLYWFNPLIWLAQKQFILEREHACDELVVAHSTKPSAYADMLLNFARFFSLQRAAYAGLSMAGSKQIEGRLMAILNGKQKRTGINRSSAVKAALLLSLVFPMLSFSPFAVGAGNQAVDTTHTALVIESLKYALADDDGDVRERAIQTLGKINTKAANELLFTSLQESHDWEIEINAARILLQRGETRALVKFFDGLEHENEKRRIRSAKILRELKHPDGLKPLLKALDDPSRDVRKQALKAICEIRTTACIKPLADQMQNGDQEFRALAAWGLGEIEDAATLPYLYAALKDPNAKVRSNAIESIGDLELAESAPHIQPLLADDEWFVRREAVRVLAEIGSIESVPLIIDALHDEHWKVRESAAAALGELGDRRALVPLSAALHDKSDNVRQEAAEALGEFYKEK